jgi:hypothetical protein
MSSTESPAGDLALAIHEGAITAGDPLPPPARLMAKYDVPPATVMAALERLSLVGVIGGDAGQGSFAALELTGQARQVLDIMAAPAMCRRVAAMPGGRLGPFAAREVLQSASERFLAVARRALRGELTERDAPAVAAAREILAVGSQPAAAQRGGPGSRRVGPGSAGRRWPGSAEWPATAGDGVAAAGPRNGGAGRVSAGRRAAGPAPASRRAP